MSNQVVNMTPRCYYLDIEVDNVPKQHGEPLQSITQIAVLDPLRPKGDRIFNAYLKPPKALRNNSFEKQESGPTLARRSFKKEWPQLVKWINAPLDGNRKAIIIMHNGFQHDWPILKNEVARALIDTNVAIPRFWQPFDTLYLKNALRINGDGSLTGLCHKLGVKVRKAHDACEDVKMTKAIFQKMIGNAPLDKVLLAALSAEHPVRQVAAVVNSYVVGEFVLFDFESTGLFPAVGSNGENPRAVQLAGYIPKVDKVFNKIINPEMAIPRTASSVHRIYDADVQSAATFKSVWSEFENFITEHLGSTANCTPVLGGHNIWGYDLKLYKSECERTGLKAQTFKSFDTLALARNQFKGIKGIPRSGFFKQEYLAPLLGVNVIGAHDAKSDVLANWQMIQVFISGVNKDKVSRAILSPNPILTLGQLCRDEGDFEAEKYWKLYNKACDLSIDLARHFFKGITNDDFFEITNLAALLDINIGNKDPELYTRWRIFLKLSQGVDRKKINHALRQREAFSQLITLCQIEGSFDGKKCLENNKEICSISRLLAQELFDGHREIGDDLEKVAKFTGIEIDHRGVSLFVLKRIFLVLTAGLNSEEVEKAFATTEPIKTIKTLIQKKGTFFAPEPIDEASENKLNASNNDSVENYFSSPYTADAIKTGESQHPVESKKRSLPANIDRDEESEKEVNFLGKKKRTS